jgi:hypothetical protein
MSNETERNDRFLITQIRLDALRAWRRPRPAIRPSRDRKVTTPIAPGGKPLPEGAAAT